MQILKKSRNSSKPVCETKYGKDESCTGKRATGRNEPGIYRYSSGGNAAGTSNGRNFENKESIQMELETSELLEKEFQRRIQQLQKEVEQKKEKEAIYLKSAEAAHLESAALDQKIYFCRKM